MAPRGMLYPLVGSAVTFRQSIHYPFVSWSLSLGVGRGAKMNGACQFKLMLWTDEEIETNNNICMIQQANKLQRDVSAVCVIVN